MWKLIFNLASSDLTATTPWTTLKPLMPANLYCTESYELIMAIKFVNCFELQSGTAEGGSS